ncbi:lamin tail domain-containing protein [Arsenicicoccus bolidensis]|uniref:lamin tail domain-containing protein n=1 Tax=Arsenicicoccus bolidensis TaxID=229480 RepID=UPI0035E40E46
MSAPSVSASASALLAAALAVSVVPASAASAAPAAPAAAPPPPPLQLARFQADAGGTKVKDDKKNVNGEYLQVRNTSAKAINVTGYWFRDTHGNRFVFPRGSVIGARTTVTVYTVGDAWLPLACWASPPVDDQSRVRLSRFVGGRHPAVTPSSQAWGRRWRGGAVVHGTIAQGCPWAARRRGGGRHDVGIMPGGCDSPPSSSTAGRFGPAVGGCRSATALGRGAPVGEISLGWAAGTGR